MDRRHSNEPSATGQHDADLELVRAVRAGDSQAQAVFVRRMHVVGRILATRNAKMGRPLGSHELADLVQDTLLCVWKKLETYSGEAALESWVYKFCFLELMNCLRRRSYRVNGSAELPLDDAGEPVDTRIAEDVRDDSLAPFLRHLAQREAEAVRLRHVEQLSFHELAEALQISTSSAKTHYYRGLRKLRQIFDARAEPSSFTSPIRGGLE